MTPEEQIIENWSRALLTSAQMERAVDLIREQMSELLQAMKKNRVVDEVLGDPLLTKEQKVSVLAVAFSPPPHRLSIAFLDTMIEHQRTKNLRQVLEAFVRIAAQPGAHVGTGIAEGYGGRPAFYYSMLTPGIRRILEEGLTKAGRRPVILEDLAGLMSRSVLLKRTPS